MRKIVYYVAASIDGFIAGPNDDISDFKQGGKSVEKYKADLQNFDTVIMGRRTYEFGYQYGLKPGQPAYGHMEHYIFSETLHFEEKSKQVHVRSIKLEHIEGLKLAPGTDIYLCGGAIFATWLLENKMIDEIKIKMNPFILGKGIPLFTETEKSYHLELLKNEKFDDGLQFNTFRVIYD